MPVLTSVQLCKSGPKNGVGASEDLILSVKEKATELAKLNPTQRQATSPMLDGKWRLVFSTTKGPSSGMLGPFVGDVFQDIVLEQEKYFNILELGFVEAVLSAHWDVMGQEKWRVFFDDIQFSLFGIPVFKKEFSSSQRDQVLEGLDTLGGTEKEARSSNNGGIWDMAYCNDTLRVLWAYGVQREASKASIYVLEREK
ncbi:hypothetical protein GUITHDRAFT_109982 [Guillardia theta CCMP2712]|uniref:Plastid lipid-associated protein/fibrillin conserved domain-containing protein n=1 Tax=Guillardia theta (strain CCMP2712) TaxID=905079 RepID=L1J7Z3_GUITC|nr:hypothetical protein GUITHDRAFT_109982 [Guillardia theta CCMP2712]EKX44195.1 hypothetical protein GUITHDRAFT_109982 [Guillardia theta CCMP2712]|eukprot:XP_005831175.1 hypothetical protein GUITHDRAFT_109982 [Guillardia theta CCMP2712]